ncbi:putative FKBP-type peptidyl-prolyl cis-trans isomerase [Monocercomonoides exilis]|uniref:putative FKBP-type peptidyl-prolyl cis-trans isomerase n=1 Tax=Monocercomonoides exilis TaxID=2049356 RepID=UPI00355AAFAC|nr:putative FKBP-type peptidyl-prolyl cis-trans isomerase [Monocercomonoides exilis]|eukprot:MONOS_8878.1-p1 / transcript=MONOS_8878.1 / gene=MONOS_8878 / organism=Monocercomonoides_exilis_PA203 / gene_product=FKBP-type peptidyl-prolyl cis-trans isomerase 5 isoform 1 / transcript_product=FKBP-type peptidyl-prolyl cis-trans isomerase 5 isoform 1 / location=Mono_scaffold00348:30997-32125(-) / protein_length=358 / sequence_SO=supercontig / SO=protein_coding / is_pseudo=false
MAVIVLGNNLLASNLSVSAIIISLFSAVGYAMSFFVKLEKLMLMHPISMLVASTAVFFLSMQFNARQISLYLYTFISALRLMAHLTARLVYDKTDRRLDNVRGCKWRRLAFFTGMSMLAFAFTAPSSVVCSIRPAVQPRFNATDVFGAIVWWMGLIVETTSDLLLLRFRHSANNRGQIYNHWLWRFMRHPNYIGNLHQVWGNFILSASALKGSEWSLIVAPIFFTAMMLFGSGIPAAEWATRKRFGNNVDFRNYVANAGMYLPFIAMAKALWRKMRGTSSYRAVGYTQDSTVQQNNNGAFAPRKPHELNTYPRQGTQMSPSSTGHMSAYGIATDSKMSQMMEGDRHLPQLGSGISNRQ